MKTLAKLVEACAKFGAGKVSFWGHYQPRLPLELMKK